MCLDDKPKKLYIDGPTWQKAPKVDDFLVAVGKKKSNSVYHIAEVKPGRVQDRKARYYLNVYKTDLITALRRGPDQALIAVTWYSRNKKN